MKKLPPNCEPALQRQVYLLTCWREQNDEAQTMNWRFKLETPGPSQRRLFKTLGEVMKTIEAELRRDNPWR
jgi:hypothetical protein